MADTRVGIEIVANNRTGPAMKQVQGAMRDLQGQSSGVEKALSGLGGYFTGGAVLQFAQQLGTAALRMAEFAQQTHMVRTSMQGLASSFGESADGMIAAMQRASGGTISEYNLMLAANKAMMLGVASNATELEGILRVAMTRGAAMGLSTTQAFDDLVTGLGRGSALILDNLGITMASLKSAEADYAAALGKTTDALTDQERKQAMVNAVLKESESIDPTAVNAMASGYDRLRAAASDLSATLGDELVPNLNEAASSTATLLSKLNELLKNDSTSPWLANLNQALGPDFARQSAGMAALAVPPASRGSTSSRFDNDLIAAEQYRAAETQRIREKELADVKANQEAQAAIVRSVQERLIAESYRLYEQLRDVGFSPSDADAIRLNALSAALANYNQNARSISDGTLRLSEASRVMNDFVNANILFAEANQNTASAAGAAAAAVDQLSGALTGMGGAMGGAMGFIGGMIGRLDEMSKAARQAKQDLFDMSANTIKGANLAAVSTLGAATAQALYTQQIDTLNTARAEMMASGMSVVDVEFQLAQLQSELTGQTNQLVLAVQKAKGAFDDNTTSANAYATALGDVNSALASRVQGAVNAQLDPGVGVNPQDYMPRQDAPNENARRLADIMVNGFKGQDWMGQFQNEVPDIYQMLVDAQDPQAAAAQLLQQFQQGMLPQLIDKEALKQQIKDQLAGDANMASYAQQIMQELIAEGAGDPAAVQQAVNQTMGTSMGKTTGPTDVTAGVVSQLKAETFLKQLNGAGGDAAAQWGSAFLASVGENVPMALIMILATLVAPILAQGQADAAGQTGAQ